MRWRRFFLSKLKLKLPVQHSSYAELSQYLAPLSCSCPEREWVQPGVSAAAQFMQHHQEGPQDRCILPALRAASRTPARRRRDPGDHVEPSGDQSETIPTEAASHSKLPGFLWSCNVCTLVYILKVREGAAQVPTAGIDEQQPSACFLPPVLSAFKSGLCCQWHVHANSTVRASSHPNRNRVELGPTK